MAGGDEELLVKGDEKHLSKSEEELLGKSEKRLLIKSKEKLQVGVEEKSQVGNELKDQSSTTNSSTTKTITTTKTTSTELEKLKPRKIKFGTKLINLNSNVRKKPVESERLKMTKIINQNSSSDQGMDKAIKFNFVEDVTVNQKTNLKGIAARTVSHSIPDYF